MMRISMIVIVFVQLAVFFILSGSTGTYNHTVKAVYEQPAMPSDPDDDEDENRVRVRRNADAVTNLS